MSFYKEQLQGFLGELRKQKRPRPWLILLEGDLGAGKTTWTQELVCALGGDVSGVKSPTFLKLMTHDIPGFGQLLHMDAYRVEGIDEFLRLGLESYENVSAMVVEWPTIFMDFLNAYPEYKRLLGLDCFMHLRFGVEPTGKRTLSVSEGRL